MGTAGTPSSGIVLVDKPQGWTSHQVVGRMRRLLGTRKVGHAGTLDPMATGLLIMGANRATRLLGHLAGRDKTYLATIRLGQSSSTDDAEGELSDVVPAAGLADEAVEAAMVGLRGSIEQVPSSVSAIKVGGRRAYALVRAGEEVELAARTVEVTRFEVTGRRVVGDLLDLDVVVDCSSGTYIRALARDLGAVLGTGGHLTMLRRTRIGGFDLPPAPPDLNSDDVPALVGMGEVARRVFDCVDISAEDARALGYGQRIQVTRSAAAELAGEPAAGELAAIGPDGDLVALLGPDTEAGWARPTTVFAPAGKNA
ncbi:tRNA pseudouridine(55) synthase TruB [Aestuariimicrobium sp. Y1814]|uniref:tRNA pseudouridine(55) synthase TruB n=1 Tax=Aestuariimicrobium sp. Y1814 TaxID=3418742 RepID=UPI003DA76606